MDVARPPYPHPAFWPPFFLIALLFFSAIAWAGGPKRHFDIPAGELGETLLLFSRATGIETMQGGLKGTSHVICSAVVGDFEPLEALARMLEGTEFTFELKGGNTVVIVPIKSSSGPKARESGQKPPVSVSGSRLQGTDEGMQQVVVTGSLIRGVMDIMSPLMRVSQSQARESPYETVQDVLQSLPVNYRATQNETLGGAGNFNRGSAINLRGLGSGATLVLVDGHRLPSAGFNGDFVDVSSIPWSMIDRVEVLPDGASALYGSDAIAGVVNVIMRDSLQGMETKFKAGTAQDGASEMLAAQLFGRQGEEGKWLLGYQYAKRTALAAADRTYTANGDKRPFGRSDFRSASSNPR